MCSINLGEARYLELRARGAQENGVGGRGGAAGSRLRRSRLAARPGRGQRRGRISYADAFCVATAERLGTTLMTEDPEIVAWVKERGGEVIDLRRDDG